MSKELTRCVSIRMPSGKELNQIVSYEFELKYYLKCKSIRHGVDSCHLNERNKAALAKAAQAEAAPTKINLAQTSINSPAKVAQIEVVPAPTPAKANLAETSVVALVNAVQAKARLVEEPIELELVVKAPNVQANAYASKNIDQASVSSTSKFVQSVLSVEDITSEQFSSEAEVEDLSWQLEGGVLPGNIVQVEKGIEKERNEAPEGEK